MQPNTGITMGTMISEPRPVEIRTGRRARSVVPVVMRHGRARRRPASTVADWILLQIGVSPFVFPEREIVGIISK